MDTEKIVRVGEDTILRPFGTRMVKVTTDGGTLIVSEDELRRLGIAIATWLTA